MDPQELRSHFRKVTPDPPTRLASRKLLPLPRGSLVHCVSTTKLAMITLACEYIASSSRFSTCVCLLVFHRRPFQVPSKSPFAGPLEQMQRLMPLMEEEVAASEEVLTDLLDKLSDMVRHPFVKIETWAEGTARAERAGIGEDRKRDREGLPGEGVLGPFVCSLHRFSSSLGPVPAFVCAGNLFTILSQLIKTRKAIVFSSKRACLGRSGGKRRVPLPAQYKMVPKRTCSQEMPSGELKPTPR